MHLSLLHRYRTALRDSRCRRLFLAMAAVVLLVQTGFPAHQVTHPIGSQDNLCQYCVLAGHAFGVPGVVVALPVQSVYAEYGILRAAPFHVRRYPRTRFSRAPPEDSFA
jgi:hypothetical protein